MSVNGNYTSIVQIDDNDFDKPDAEYCLDGPNTEPPHPKIWHPEPNNAAYPRGPNVPNPGSRHPRYDGPGWQHEGVTPIGYYEHPVPIPLDAASDWMAH